MAKSVIVKSTLISKWLPSTEASLDRAVLEIATDIDRSAKILAPKATGALVKSGRIKRNKSADYSIIFGGSRVPYARRRHYENRKTPGSIKYLERSGDSIARNGLSKYLRVG